MIAAEGGKALNPLLEGLHLKENDVVDEEEEREGYALDKMIRALKLPMQLCGPFEPAQIIQSSLQRSPRAKDTEKTN